MTTAADLRCYDPLALRSDTRLYYCTGCTCPKSGHADEPNFVDESCDDVICPCHLEGAVL